MDEIRTRLTRCFEAVFPELTAEAISHASPTTVTSWDSATTVTLFAVVEEEFDISIEGEDLMRFDSFEGILNYLCESSAEQKSSDSFAERGGS